MFVILKLVLTQRDTVFTDSFILLTRWRRDFNLCKRHGNSEKCRMHKDLQIMLLHLFQCGHFIKELQEISVTLGNCQAVCNNQAMYIFYGSNYY